LSGNLGRRFANLDEAISQVTLEKGRSKYFSDNKPETKDGFSIAEFIKDVGG
jgi:hypothetical protein